MFWLEYGVTYLAHKATDGFNNATSFNGAVGDTWQERGEEEKVTRRDNLNVVVRVVEVAQEAVAAPSTPENNHLLLLDFLAICG